MAWIEINNYPDYMISDSGEVKSISRQRISIGQKGILKERILKQFNHPRGYKKVSLKKDKSNHQFLVHRLVAEGFIPKVNGKDQINHKNGVKTDNRADNLEWCNGSENQLHRYRVLKLDNKKKNHV